MPKHDAIVNYRDAQVPVMVHSVMGEYNMHVTALVHGAAVDAGAMGSLWCQDDLLPARQPVVKVIVEEALVQNNKLARSQAFEFSGDAGATTGV